ncbi:amidohydrolase [Tabrizicola piscis]|uniref:Amidohydrolase n=1 Tax=Tabrizicola piscis TaxID=2494374 RepID=A0A3S8U7J7_9RHOB|nr:amidohydrolase [Tabrizicola piscis]AZL59553.1 amidohydrolase [Tabrizicola piscis]
MLTNSDFVELIGSRHHLHRYPEVSGEEVGTAAYVAAELAKLQPDHLVTNVGGHGVAAVWDMAEPGPTVMFRSELDALPINEVSDAEHRSTVPGEAHLCGHDGHTTILLGLARLVVRRPSLRGRVVLMFQPAEEDGSGAAAVLADPRFGGFKPDWSFALHNMPGIPLGQVVTAPGPANCASEGLRVVFQGKTSHASMPENGVSPALAIVSLIPAALAAGKGGDVGPGFRLVSVCHASMGEPAFGITPGEGEVWLTLRTLFDSDMGTLRAEVMDLAAGLAVEHGLQVTFTHHDRFAACANHPEAAQTISRAVDDLGIARSAAGLPMRASEDFGIFGQHSMSAMFLLGAGEASASLHNPDYDFPDALIPKGVAIFDRIRQDLLG